MLATACSATLVGLDAHPVRVEVETSRGVPSFELVGLAEAAVRESRVRVKSALAQVGINLGEYHIVVNLAPADFRKAGSGFDVAIAAATCGALRIFDASRLGETLFLGELSLNGSVQPLRGVLPHLIGARARGVRAAVVPHANDVEAGLVEGVDVRTAATFEDLLKALRGEVELPRAVASVRRSTQKYEDLADVRGQTSARRALEVAAAGSHNLLMIGPPGCGKTMLARRLPGLLPALTAEEALEVTAIQSVAGLLGPSRELSDTRPFRAPHHTVSPAGLVGGGGDFARPGEISLAHLGVLFLDELAELRRPAIEALRQPLEDGLVMISRARVRATFPARPLLVCAMNPCACGYLGDGAGRCSCSAERVRIYRARLSGPLLDRLDVHVVLPPVTVAALQGRERGESTESVRARVERARETQRARYDAGETSAATNGALSPGDLERVAALCSSGQRLLASAVGKLGLSARAYGKVLRVARTIADLEGSTSIAPPHVSEAISARVLDRGAVASATAA